ncbi:MAG: hypothetical protein JST15_04435 [Bacteroidetes bacterium]|nr:hypothetical protein [Bacteroidota bacterium]
MKKALNHFTLFCLVIFTVTGSAFSANELFRSKVSGNWNATSTWEMSTNGGTNWIPATLTPTNLSGAITIAFPTVVNVTADVTADQITIQSGAELSIDPGITLTYPGNASTFTLSGATVSGAGTFKVEGPLTMDLKPSGVFSAGLRIASGSVTATDFTAPRIGRLYGQVTVDSGATLGSYLTFHNADYNLEFYGNLTNNGTITSAPAVSDNKRHTFKGSILINNGIINPSIFNIDSVANVSGTGTFAPTNYLSVGTNGNITLLSNVNFSPGGTFYIFTGGILNPNGKTVNYTSGTLEIQSGAAIVNSGIFKTYNTVTLNLRAGSAFNAPLNVTSGSFTRATDFTSPFVGKLYGNVTVDTGGTLGSYLTFHNTSYSLTFYGNLTNNGTITSTTAGSNKNHTFKGSTLINNGIINPSVFTMDSVSSVTGTGTLSPANNLVIGANGNITLSSNATFSPANQFIFTSGATLNPNGNTVNYTSGTLVLNSGATITNSGLFKTQNALTFNLRGGSAFNAPLNITSGSTVTATDLTTPYLGKLFGDVTIDAGGTLGSYLTFNNTSYSLDVYGNVTNNGTITANTAAIKTFSFYGSSFINNGLVSHPYFSFRSAATLYGIGSFTSNASVLSGAAVTLNSNHKFANLNINTGGSFNMDNRVVGFTSSNPIIQNGTFTNANSRIEYNGSSLQNISTANIVYAGLRINNPAGASFLGNVTVNDTLSVIQGSVNLNGKIITLSSTGYLTETPGNVLFGTAGYIAYSRDIGTPSSLNAGGLGAVLTSASNLGVTEIKRGHTVQTGLNGGTSIKRYYDINPSVNSGLNASLVFKYDDTELNGKPETLLRLFKSTNSGSTWLYQTGNVNILANEITLSGINSFSRWSSDSSAASASVKMIMEGFYNPATNKLNMNDTVRAYLRNAAFPFAIVDSAKEIVNLNTLKVSYKFANAVNGNYYLQMKHRNSIETWSNSALTYNVSSTLNYDFTFSANQAFGNNQINVDNTPVSFAFYSGDINQDGTIDASDVSEVDNDANISLSGYVKTDVTGDDFVDAQDVSIVDNNANISVTAVTP